MTFTWGDKIAAADTLSWLLLEQEKSLDIIRHLCSKGALTLKSKQNRIQQLIFCIDYISSKKNSNLDGFVTVRIIIFMYAV